MEIAYPAALPAVVFAKLEVGEKPIRAVLSARHLLKLQNSAAQ